MPSDNAKPSRWGALGPHLVEHYFIQRRDGGPLHAYCGYYRPIEANLINTTKGTRPCRACLNRLYRDVRKFTPNRDDITAAFVLNEALERFGPNAGIDWD